MAQEEREEMQEDLQEEPSLRQSDKAFDKLSAVEPERDVLIDDDDEGLGGHRSLSERMKESPNLTDIQSLDKGMFPDLGYNHLNFLMVSRVFPDTYNPLQSILVKDLLMNNPDLSVAEAIALVHTSESIAIDGEGRIDKLALGGAVHDDEAKKDEAKGMGGL